MKSDAVQSLHVKGYNPDYKDPKYITVPNASTKSLRWWQIDAFNLLKDSRFALIVAFCGSGKSILQIALSIHDIVTSGWKQKQLIVVPQQHISGSFIGDDERSYLTLEVNGNTYDWKVEHNFCDDTNVIENLRNWLLTDGETLGKKFRGKTLITNLCAVCSHQALGLVWKTLDESQKKQAVKNLTLRVDEAHHISGVYDLNDDEYTTSQQIGIDEIRTNLGEVCSYIMNCRNEDSKIHMTTATPYRGDQDIILSPKAKLKFKTYFLDWIVHFNTLGIERFDLTYQEYAIDPINAVVRQIKNEPNEKHLVVIPSTGTKWRTNGKTELAAFFSALYKVVPKDRVLDLVTQSTQDTNKAKLLKEPKCSDNGKSKFDVVVTCMLGREGTDWCPCSRLHNTSNESSITLAVQTIGRPFRRFEGKNSVSIINYIPKFAAPKAGMGRAELLTDRTNALLVCMQMDEMCKPIMIPVIKSSEKTAQGHHSSITSERMSLAGVFGTDYQDFKKDLIEEVESLSVKDEEALNEVVSDLVAKYRIKNNVKNVEDGVKALVLRILSAKLKALDICVDVSFIREQGFGNLVEKYVDKDASIFFGNYSKEDWQKIREILRKTWDEKFIAWAKEKGVTNKLGAKYQKMLF